jgi:hypothetical protein
MTLKVLPAGHGRLATERIAASEKSEPSVATSTFNAWCRPFLLCAEGRTISTEHDAWRSTERAVLPKRTRINVPSSLVPTCSKSAFQEVATLEMTWRALPKRTLVPTFQPAATKGSAVFRSCAETPSFALANDVGNLAYG